MLRPGFESWICLDALSVCPSVYWASGAKYKAWGLGEGVVGPESEEVGLGSSFSSLNFRN